MWNKIFWIKFKLISSFPILALHDYSQKRACFLDRCSINVPLVTQGVVQLNLTDSSLIFLLLSTIRSIDWEFEMEQKQEEIAWKMPFFLCRSAKQHQTCSSALTCNWSNSVKVHTMEVGTVRDCLDQGFSEQKQWLNCPVYLNSYLTLPFTFCLLSLDELGSASQI